MELGQHCPMARMNSRPRSVRVFYRGIPYDLDLTVCRIAMVDRQVDGELDSMESLAGKVAISRSTASRFFSGRPTSLAVTLKILGVLNVKFEDVATPADQPDKIKSDTEGADGPASTPVKPLPKPTGGGDTSAARRRAGSTS